VTNGLVYLPQGIGYAIVAGVNPIYGLYTGFLPPVLAALTTGSIYMEVIATNELSTPIGRIGRELHGGFTAEKLFALTLLVGLFAMAAGLLRLGRVVRYISSSVMTGFVLGIMTMLILGQVVNLTGFQGQLSGNDVLKTIEVLMHPGEINLFTVVVGVITITSTAFLLRTRWSRFAYLAVLVVISAAVHMLGAGDIALAGAHHQIHTGFPRLVLPDFRALPELLLPAFTLTILGLSFGAAVAQSYPSPDGEIGNPSRDFLGQGVANLVSSLFQCMPSSGSMSRTAYLVDTGAVTRWANIFTGMTVLAVVLTCANLAEQIPLAVVAGILMVIGYMAIDFHALRLVWQINWTERITMTATAALTILVSPPLAILGGMMLSFISFIRTSASSIALTSLLPGQDGGFTEHPVPDHLLPGSISMLRLHGYLFFAGISAIETQLQPFLRVRNAALILSMRGYMSVGSNGLIFLDRFTRQMSTRGNLFLLADISDEIQKEFGRTGVLRVLGAGNVFASRPVLDESLNEALQAATTRLGQWQATATESSVDPHPAGSR
jgi:SulP family sulfate permease